MNFPNKNRNRNERQDKTTQLNIIQQLQQEKQKGKRSSTQMTLCSSYMKSIHIWLGSHHNNLEITKVEQVEKNPMEIVFSCYVQGSFILVVLKRNQRRWIRPIRVDDVLERVKVIRSNCVEEWLVVYEPQRLWVHVLYYFDRVIDQRWKLCTLLSSYCLFTGKAEIFVISKE